MAEVERQIEKKHLISITDEIMDDGRVITCLDKNAQSTGCPCVSVAVEMFIDHP